jgi:hypothetical protein
MRSGVGVWPRVMKRENQGLCNGRERKKRERSKEASRGERENREKRNVGLVTVIKLGPT